MLKQFFSSGFWGLCALGAVNLVGGFTGFSLGASWLSLGTAFFLGIPGVTALSLLNMLLQ